MSDANSNETLIASAGGRSRPYGDGTQILVIGVHGTSNTPQNITNVTSAIATGLAGTTTGRVLHNSGFDWSASDRWGADNTGRSAPENQQSDRGIAARRLATHVLSIVDEQHRNGNFNRDRPMVIDLVGFSHGGNVAIQAVKDITEGLKERGLNTNSGIHLTTLSTPAYIYDKWGNYNKVEGPGPAAENARIDGVSFAHTHFSVRGDGVIRLAAGNDTYGSAVTRNYTMDGIGIRSRPDLAAQDGITNHGLPQDSPSHMQFIADTMAARFRGFNPDNRRADASLDTPQTTATLASARTEVTAQDFGNRAGHFTQALTATNGNTNVAAALVESSARASFDPNGEFNVKQSTKNNELIAMQGSGASALRADPVDPSKVTQPAQTVAAALNTSAAPTQIAVAAVPEETLSQGRGRTA
jgi:hypothetical protein